MFQLGPWLGYKFRVLSALQDLATLVCLTGGRGAKAKEKQRGRGGGGGWGINYHEVGGRQVLDLASGGTPPKREGGREGGGKDLPLSPPPPP